MTLFRNLPKNYKGYLTTELLDLCEQRRSPDGIKIRNTERENRSNGSVSEGISDYAGTQGGGPWFVEGALLKLSEHPHICPG